MSKESTKKLLSSPAGAQAGLEVMRLIAERLAMPAIAKLEADLNSANDTQRLRAATAVLRLVSKWHVELLKAEAYMLAAVARQEAHARDGRRAQGSDGLPVEIRFAGDED